MADFAAVFSVPLWAAAIVLGALILGCGIVAGRKERWGWVAAGFLTGGLLWIVGALLPARPGSPWAARPRGAGRPPA